MIFSKTIIYYTYGWLSYLDALDHVLSRNVYFYMSYIDILHVTAQNIFIKSCDPVIFKPGGIHGSAADPSSYYLLGFNLRVI